MAGSTAGSACSAISPFLPAFEAWKTTGVWLFIIGAAAMFVGALGQFFVNLGDGDD